MSTAKRKIKIVINRKFKILTLNKTIPIILDYSEKVLSIIQKQKKRMNQNLLI